jgi:hypothetical protein
MYDRQLTRRREFLCLGIPHLVQQAQTLIADFERPAAHLDDIPCQ